MAKPLFDYRIFRIRRQNVSASAALRWLRTSSLWTYRALAWSALAVVLACAAVILSLRYWILPNVERYREDIAQAVSKAAGQRVTIGRISANWDGARPQLLLEDITVYDRAQRAALALSRVDGTLSWLSLATLRPRFHALDIYRPVLDVRRDAAGVISVAGIEISGERRDGGGFADWLLEQRDVEVHDAAVAWTDELRAAPRLELRQVRLHVVNRGERHRFGLQAVPPAALAGPLDLRGDLRGSSIGTIEGWSGRLFLQLDYADIAAWRTWVPFPIEFPRGAGALRAWLTLEERELKELIADVRLAGVRARLGAELPELDLAQLAGRIGWRSQGGGFEVSTSKLGLTTSGGLTLQPADFLLRVSGRGGKGERGELQANALDLAPLVRLADHLPLDPALRKRLVALSPQGSLYDVVARWSGALPEPQQYSVRGRFQGLALNREEGMPGFSGVSGNVDGNERGGTLHLNAQQAALQMPNLFREPLAFDALTAQIGWSRAGGTLELRLNNVSFSNPDLAGTVFGTYRSADGGSIDLTGNLTRADARSVSRYLPLTVARHSRPWLERALIAGRSSDVRFRASGKLADFPFPDNKGGVFYVSAKVSGGVLDYADGWPRIEGIEGDLNFRGKRMDLAVRQASLYGVKLTKVNAEIPDLKYSEEILTVSGEAEGPTADFLQFIDKSPVAAMIDRFTDGMQVQGRGRLQLKLVLPLQATRDSKVSGSYQFVNNHLVAEPDLPPFEQLNGRLEFTESAVRVPSASAVLLGGPVSITVATQRDATVRLTLAGRVNADNVRRSGGPEWMSALRGSADWRGTFTLRKKNADLVIESSLQGLASNLPAPFVKSAAETVPLRIERRFLGPDRDRLSLSYGEVFSAQLNRRQDGGRTVIDRGVVRFGSGPAAEPERNGVWVSGTLKSFDLDDWLKLAAGGEGASFTLGGVDLKVGELDFFNRTFHDLSLSGGSQAGALQLALGGREIEGTANWRPQGKGRLVARLKKLTIPAAQTVASVPSDKPTAGAKTPELPALDIVAEQFQLAEKPLGRLELTAVPEDRDWRIEKLRISNPESNLLVDGVWQGWLTQPRTQVNIRLETSDIGRLLTRLGYPEGVRRGNAKIEGTLVWAGSPQQIDYPTLSGNFVLDAARGQFLKLEPGLGKLLGILSLQALPRRITLDFRDIFSDGFAFDEIIGAVKVSRGIATTENFRISGPSARVVMSGEVDLARETQKLRVRVTPSLSDGVSIAGALIGGPIAGVATFLAQKILRDPLDQLVAFEYSVTGTWSEPQVTKIEAGGAEPGRPQ
jgi:uncharacterized protein (TIGR02099 family)